jgi:hypothetical protein
MLVRLLTAAIASALMVAEARPQDGARAYHLTPADTDIISLTTTILRTEIGGSAFDARVVTPSYRPSIDVVGNAGTLLIGIPVGDLSAALQTPIGTINLDSDIALGDLYVGGSLGLLGSPSLSPVDYAQYKPGLRVSVAAKWFLPTGDYDSSRVLNLGANRWSLQASLPISYVLGNSMIDPDLTTFEIVPMVEFFGDNDDPFGPASVVSQDPLFRVEGHVTRNFGQPFWASLDGAFDFGGRVRADGIPQGEAEKALALGATLGWTPSPTLALRISYEEVVYSSVPDIVNRNVRATTAFRF